MHVNFLAPARAEFREAIAFYNDRKAGLGSEFAEEVKKTIERVVGQFASGHGFSRAVAGRTYGGL